jgi:hypothetical protein
MNSESSKDIVESLRTTNTHEIAATHYRLLDEAADEIERLRSQVNLVKALRDRACPAGLPHTGDNPKDDHGHTDCWLHHQAADEIERLRALIAK